MAMTAMVKDELSRVECTKTSERKAEVTALLRFSGGLHIVGGRVVIEAELDGAPRHDPVRLSAALASVVGAR